MQRDLRGSSLYKEAEELLTRIRRPGTGQISELADLHVSSHGRSAVFAGTVAEKLEGALPTRIAEIDLASGSSRVLTGGPNTDRHPRYSPDARHIAFLSDRHQEGDFQLFVLNRDTGVVRAAPPVDGWVEYLHWSPDGRRILLGVAGHGADISGGQGSGTSKRFAENAAPWMPLVESGRESFRWRQAWLYDLAADHVWRVSRDDINVWESAWCGNDALVAVASPGPAEGLWYSARLQIINIESRITRELHAPRDQLGWPASSPSGKHVAIVEAFCSDRWLVAGDLLVIDVATGKVHRADTCGVDVTSVQWRSDNHVLLAGHRGFESVVGVYELSSGTFNEVWMSRDVSGGGQYISVAGFGSIGDCAFVAEGFLRPPEVAVIRAGQYRRVKSFDTGYLEEMQSVQEVRALSWVAPDGLEIQGWLLRPHGGPPYPLVMSAHGGPVWNWHPRWLARGAAIPLLLRRGYACFFPNPRGSSGRGQRFARLVVGDMGGGDAQDCLAGIDHLLASGFADARRLGVTGASYGGFLSSWLITQDSRFAAAVPVAPVTNHVSSHLTSNIPHFVRMFLADNYTNPTGKYFQRSPVMHAHRVRTPTLNVCGALDRCTPPTEAVQFHNALLENGVKSVLVTYPQEGHGVRKFPAAIDYAARIVNWFEDHIAARERA